jgi:cysteinyl-tRNA synthetase
LALRLYNSLTRKKDRFISSSHDTVKFFVCGPTVYDYVHLGHARTYLAFDIVTRYLEYLGYSVRYLMNITDVADRLIQRAEEMKKEPLELAREYESAFKDDLKALGVTNVEGFERASEYIPQMLTQIKGLVDKGIAYQTETGVYFEVRKFPKFGQLAGYAQEELGLRRLELCSSKKNPEDFSLWRRHDDGLRWDSPWGSGRPGWHVEDTAISIAHFGDNYDLHGGASELIFPHHEAEIAQAEALTGKTPFVRFWLHTGLLTIEGRKMSKSLGNVIRIRDALKKHTAAVLRYYFASFHYRAQVNLTESGLGQAARRLGLIRRNFDAFRGFDATHEGGKERKLATLVKEAESDFRKHMDNDFDSPKAIEVLARLSERMLRFGAGKLDQQSKADAERAFRKMADVFGLLDVPKQND